MNLGLTGLLNPLRPGNAARRARRARLLAARGREGGGRVGGLLLRGRARGQEWQGGLLAAGAPEPPAPPLLCLRALPPRPGARLCTFGPRPPGLGRGGGAGPGSGVPEGAGLGRVPGAPRGPARLRAEACARAGWRPRRCAARTLAGGGPAPRSGSRPAQGAQGSERRAGAGSAAGGGSRA